MSGATGVPVVAILGDSITAQNYSNSGASQETCGYLTWARALLRHGIYSPPALNFGVGGDRTRDIINRLDAAIATMASAGATFCIVLAGTNDINGGGLYTPAYTIANLATIYDRLKAAGVGVVAIPILPRGGSHTLSTDAKIGHLAQVNRWIARRPYSDANVIVADANPHLLAAGSDAETVPGDCIARFFRDGLHPNESGAYVIGRVLRDALARFVTPTNDGLMVSAADVYDAALNPTGSLLANGLLEGSAGTVVLGTGQVATSWTGTRDSTAGLGTLTCAWSKVSKTGKSGSYQRAVVSGTPTANRQVMLEQKIMPGALTYGAGDVLQFDCEVIVAGGGVGLAGVSLFLRDAYDATTQYGKDFDFNADAVPPTSDEYTLVLRTPPITVTTGTNLVDLRARVSICCLANVAITADVMIGNVAVRKIMG